jgi:hypothetical protein
VYATRTACTPSAAAYALSAGQHGLAIRTQARRRHERRHRARALRQVGEGEHGHDAATRERAGGVDGVDARVRVGAAHDRRVQHAGDGDVVDVAAVAGEEASIFLAADARADHGGRRRAVVGHDDHAV